MKKTDSIVRILTECYEARDKKVVEIKRFMGGSKSEIRYSSAWNKLERVWNDGHGLISFATVADKDGKLLINVLFCCKKEIKQITDNLKVPYEFVELGYPDYYNYGLESVREKRKSEQSN